VTLPWLEPDGKPATAELIPTTPTGRAINRNDFNHRHWRPALTAAGLPLLRVNGCHALRHHFASVLLAAGVDIKALSEYLGHHDPAFTLRVYVHLMPAADVRMRAAVDESRARAA
jgi:integrase